MDSYQPDNTATPTIAGMDLKWSDEVSKRKVNTGQNQLNTNLESGMYIIRIIDDNKIVNKRLMAK